jgi:Concanavalin A-like lectin/glucanases superfamily/HYR domain/Domain of unknown function DUF11/Leucine rich repeat/Secretion system C-terminal sorting domain
MTMIFFRRLPSIASLLFLIFFFLFPIFVNCQNSPKDVCANPATNIVGKSNAITITGIKTNAAVIQIFNSSWSSVYNQQVSVDSVTIPNLVVGTYNVKVTVLETGGRWPSVCEVTQNNVVVTASTNTCINGSLSFDGINDFILTNQAAIPANTDFTLEALCKSKANDAGCNGAFKRLFTFTLGNSTQRLEIGECSGKLTVFRNTTTAPNGLYEISNANTLRNGAWHHVAAVKKSDSLYVYYDGIKVLSISGVSSINSVPRSLVIGSWLRNIENWHGEMDEVRIWNYAASANQIQTLKQCQLVGNESGLVLYYPFNQGVAGGSNPSELTALDKSASANNATLNQFGLSGATSNWICSSLALTQGCPINACENDVIAPILANCPTNISVTTTSTTAVATWIAPTATDNCTSGPSVFGTQNSGFAFPLGTTAVTYTATDAKGNKATCSFNVNVTNNDPCFNETIPPVFINCPTNINLTTTGTTATATWTAPTATDNCSTPSISSNFNSGVAFPVGTTAVIYTATDVKGNKATCSFNVVVVLPSICDIDTIKPILSNCPTNISLTISGTTANSYWTAPTATDNCSTPSVLSNVNSGSAFPVGVTVVTYTATDAKGNKATCSFNVNVTSNNPCLNDTIPPVLSSCPANISVTTKGTTAVVNWLPPTFSDNCSIIFTSNYSPGFAFPLGITTVTHTVSDYEQNKVSCSFTITVTKQPIIPTCLNPLTDIVGGEETISVSNISTAASIVQIFNSSWVSVYNQQLTGTNVIIPNMPAGKYIVKVLVLKEGGVWPNICVETNYNVTVLAASNNCNTDVKPPVIENCPTNINQVASGIKTRVFWVPPTATDNCSTPSVLSNYETGFSFPLGTAKVIYTATDLRGNKSTCSFDVNISQTACGIDSIKPVINNCPADQTVTTTGTTAIVTWTPPTATDNCGIESFTSSGFAPGQSFSLGSTPVGYYAEDSSNNLSACIFFISVVKATTGSNVCTNPSANVVGGDGIITVSGITTSSAIIQVFSSTWNSVAYLKATSSTAVIPNIPNGTYFVKITVLSEGGNWPSICTVQADYVVVGATTNPCATDITPPTIVNCPPNINLLTSSSTTAVGTWVAPTATDNCTATPSLTSNINSGYLFPIGLSSVIYTATDIKGNNSTCRFNVTVLAPSSTCQLNDSLALVDLYNSTNGANWTTKWDLNTPISTWYGLDFTFNGCLRQINIPNNNLVGTIPASIGNMVELDYLNLSKNKLTGVIPTTIGKLSKLTRLFLNYNQLSGSIPSEIGNLPVIFLELTKNQLTGSIPQNLGKLQYPVSITLDSNLLTGCIPIEMKSFCNSNNIRINANVGLPNGGDWAAFCSSEAGSCSANTVNDLAVSISANPSVFKKFSDLITTVTLKNNSNQAMTNIEISVPTPKGVAAGRPAAASVGNWQPYCSGGALCNRWVIQTLAANATATLSISYYVLDADTAIVATARLNASTPADNTVANNFASISIAPAPTQQIAALSIRKPTQYIPVIIQKISPNPTDGDVYIDVESLDERDMRFEFFNAQGQNVYNEMQHLKKGSNQLYFNITDKEAGLYFVKPETSGGRNVPVKFVKL